MKDLQTVVVGFDASPDAVKALEAAADLTAEDGVVHVVVAYRPLSADETAYLWHELPQEFRSTFDPQFEPHERAGKAAGILASLGVKHETHELNGKAANAILETAEREDADLIVVGSRGLGRAARFFLGSVSTRVVTNADRSVLIVHADEAVAET